MKVNIEFECTPLEARQFLGLPDVQPMQNAVMDQLQQKMAENIDKFSPEAIMQNWFDPKMAERFQDMFVNMSGIGPDGQKIKSRRGGATKHRLAGVPAQVCASGPPYRNIAAAVFRNGAVLVARRSGGSGSAACLACCNASLRRQRSVHRTLVCDIHKFLPLLRVERSFDRDLALNLIEHAGFGFALSAILGMNLAMPQYYGYAIKRQRLPLGIQSQSDRGTGAERCKQEIVRSGSGIFAADRDRLVGYQPMRAYGHALLKFAAAGFRTTTLREPGFPGALAGCGSR